MLQSVRLRGVASMGVSFLTPPTGDPTVPVKSAKLAMSLSLLMSAPMLAAAQCCPGSGTGAELAAQGLGESHPSARNLSLDPSWRVYGFQRDGMTYYQINDIEGNVLAIVGNLDDQFWALPAGHRSHEVSLPASRLEIAPGAQGLPVYRHPDFTLLVYRHGDRSIWSVESTGP